MRPTCARCRFARENVTRLQLSYRASCPGASRRPQIIAGPERRIEGVDRTNAVVGTIVSGLANSSRADGGTLLRPRCGRHRPCRRLGMRSARRGQRSAILNGPPLRYRIIEALGVGACRPFSA